MDVSEMKPAASEALSPFWHFKKITTIHNSHDIPVSHPSLLKVWLSILMCTNIMISLCGTQLIQLLILAWNLSTCF